MDYIYGLVAVIIAFFASAHVTYEKAPIIPIETGRFEASVSVSEEDAVVREATPLDAILEATGGVYNLQNEGVTIIPIFLPQSVSTPVEVVPEPEVIELPVPVVPVPPTLVFGPDSMNTKTDVYGAHCERLRWYIGIKNDKGDLLINDTIRYVTSEGQSGNIPTENGYGQLFLYPTSTSTPFTIEFSAYGVHVKQTIESKDPKDFFKTYPYLFQLRHPAEPDLYMVTGGDRLSGVYNSTKGACN